MGVRSGWKSAGVLREKTQRSKIREKAAMRG